MDLTPNCYIKYTYKTHLKKWVFCDKIVEIHMKKLIKLLFIPFTLLFLSGCGLLEELFETDNDTIHKTSYEPITGNFVL